ncbi:MAG: hypothetical protein ABI838_02000, partial [Chloroflexota bacterium]
MSLRDRALVALVLGLAVLAGLGVFEAADARTLTEAEATQVTVRALETDNLALGAGMAAQDAGLTSYLQALALDPATVRGLGGRETLLADYLAGSGQVTDSLARIRSNSQALHMTPQAQPVIAAAKAWQAWAQ